MRQEAGMDHDEEGGQQSGIPRRTLIKRGAIVGGTLVWATPVIQSLSSPAHAQVGPGSPLCAACLAATIDGVTTHVDFDSTPDCCG